MLKPGLKFIFPLLLVFTLCTCIDPYFPKLKGYESLFIVDGLIMNDGSSYTVKLTRTIQEQDLTPEKVSDAKVFITDENGATTYLLAAEDGIYKTDSASFKGEIGKTYKLHIKTSNGNEYESDPCTMLPVADIDTVYYNKDEKVINNQTQTTQGIRIYLESKSSPGGTSYMRWDFDETWKFRIPNPKKFDYLGDSVVVSIPNSEVKEFCWKEKKSTEILINGTDNGGSDVAKKVPIQFIAPEESDRLSMKYSILVKQLSVSQKEYEFWDNLKKVNESNGDIFGSQPYTVLSNIKNISNPSERVLGYFQVSAVSKKRIYITIEEVIPLGLPVYTYQCSRIAWAPEDFPWSEWAPPLTFDDLYNMFATTPGYEFIEPIYDAATNKLSKLVFTTSECADCELSGTPKKPAFWID